MAETPLIADGAPKRRRSVCKLKSEGKPDPPVANRSRPSKTVKNVRFWNLGPFPGPSQPMLPPGLSSRAFLGWFQGPKMRAGNLLARPIGANPTVPFEPHLASLSEGSDPQKLTMPASGAVGLVVRILMHRTRALYTRNGLQEIPYYSRGSGFFGSFWRIILVNFGLLQLIQDLLDPKIRS